MEYLTDIFSTKAEQARLVTVLISVIIAVSIVLLNQHFAIRKARKEHLSEKIEELYKAILNYEKSAIELSTAMSKIWKLKKDGAKSEELAKLEASLNDLVTIVHEEVDRISMFFWLYFSNVNFTTSNYLVSSCVPALVEYKDNNENWIDHHLGFEGVSSRARELKSICFDLMKKHRR
ncbi:MAG: hypothetical protein L3J26_10350 [Candidatus Polarisedimenticolaceae bacterium]|nr:hypothetical protein [Candidatus Polarisedimenticolaceae bacterium]